VRIACWLLRLAAAGAFVAWMAYEWRRWPNGSAMLGPLGLIWYQGPDGFSLAATCVLLPAVLAFPLKPHPVTAVLSLLGLGAWWLLGAVAKGIGC
jgi:hypothetical protein